MKKLFLFFLILLYSLACFAQSYEKRIALVIGNAAYLYGGELNNPVNDAILMDSTLKSLGFEVIIKTDATLKIMQTATIDFTNKIANYDVALFFYAGHGIQVNGENYLIPVDAKLDDKASCQFEAFNINFINNAFQENQSHLNIMILDACRNNPFRSWMRGGNKGFKAISNQAAGTIIAFATREGETASDGTGNNGLFTEKLVNQMKKSQNITEVFQNTRVEVLKDSENSQCPQEWNMLTGNFSFVNGIGQAQQFIVEENPMVENNQPKNNANNDFMITEEVLTGTIKITSEHDGDFYFDGELKGKFTKGRVYTLNNIAIGKHELKLGSWKKTVAVENGKTIEISTLMVLTDNRDGKVYKTIRIGGQTWLAQNLNYYTSTSWYYDNNNSNGEQSGRLYTWQEAKKICPQGTHLPGKDDFETLLNNVGGSGETAYKALLPSGNSGFSALFGGYRDKNGSFYNIGKNAYFWSYSPAFKELAYGLEIVCNVWSAYTSNFNHRSCGFSVRCLLDK